MTPFKKLDKNFPIENYSTEWDSWCDYEVPLVNKKFGKRPFLRPSSIYGYWWQWDKTLIEKTIQQNSVIYLRHASLDYHINLLLEACKKIGAPRIIVSDTNIRANVPENVRVIVVPGLAYQFSRCFADTDIKPDFNRKIDKCKYPFMLMASSQDNGRPRLLLMLKKLGLLEKCLYSTSSISSKDFLFPEDDLGLNQVMTSLDKKIIGKEYIKFNVKTNLDIIPKFINLCNFYLAIDSNGLYDHNINWQVSEKHLWGYTTTVPVISFWCKNTLEQMQNWGFKTHNISMRQKNETIQETITRWSKEILFYYQITLDPNWSRSWQDKQNINSAKNFEIAKNLHNKIKNGISQQIEELPSEFLKV